MHLQIVVDPPFRSLKVGQAKVCRVESDAIGADAYWRLRPFMSDADAEVVVHAASGLLATYPRRGMQLEDVRGARIFCGSDGCLSDIRRGDLTRPRLLAVVAVLGLPQPIGILAQLPMFDGTSRPVHLASAMRTDAGVYMTELPAEIRCFRCGAIGLVHGVVRT